MNHNRFIRFKFLPHKEKISSKYLWVIERRPDPIGFAGAPAAQTGPGTIEISFTDAPQMRITGGVDPALASALVAALATR